MTIEQTTVSPGAAMTLIDAIAAHRARELDRQCRALGEDPEVLVLHGLPAGGPPMLLEEATRGDRAVIVDGVLDGDPRSLNEAIELATCGYGIRRLRVAIHPAALGSSVPALSEPGLAGAFDRMRGRIAAAQARLEATRTELTRLVARIEQLPAVRRALAQDDLRVEAWIWVEQSGCFCELDRGTGRLRLPARDRDAASPQANANPPMRLVSAG